MDFKKKSSFCTGGKINYHITTLEGGKRTPARRGEGRG